MKWFERHLNWTLIFGCPFTFVIGVALCFFALPPAGSSNQNALALMVVLPLLPCAWVLNRKARSYWWLILAWVPFVGWTVPITLANQSARSSTAIASSDAGQFPQNHEGQKPPPLVTSSAAESSRELSSVLGVMSVGCAILGLMASGFFDYFMVGVSQDDDCEWGRGSMFAFIIFLFWIASVAVFVGGLMVGIGSLLAPRRSKSTRPSSSKWGIAGTTLCTTLLAAHISLYFLWIDSAVLRTQ